MNPNIFLKVTLLLEISFLPFVIFSAITRYELVSDVMLFITGSIFLIAILAYVMCDIIITNIFKGLGSYKIVYEFKHKTILYISLLLMYLTNILSILFFSDFSIMYVLLIFIAIFFSCVDNIGVYKSEQFLLIGFKMINIDSIIEIKNERNIFQRTVIVTDKQKIKLSLKSSLSDKLKELI